jgi:hypothetical protein
LAAPRAHRRFHHRLGIRHIAGSLPKERVINSPPASATGVAESSTISPHHSSHVGHEPSIDEGGASLPPS